MGVSHVGSCRLGFVLYGACALIAQLLCLQELLIVFAGHELFLGCSLAAWMGWVGLGSLRAQRIPSDRLGLLVGASIPLLIGNLIAIRVSTCLFGFGMLIGLLPMLVLTAVLLAPIGLLVGALFSVGCAHAEERHGFPPAAAYLWETLGAAGGGVLYSWLIAGRLSSAWVIAALAVPTALAAWRLTHRAQRRVTALVALGLAACFALSPLPRWTRALQWRGYTIVDETASRYGHHPLARTGALVSLFENGAISAHFPDPAAYEELVHWPLLMHPSPRRVLVIGNAATGSLAEILKHPITQVDYVELDPAVIRLLRPALDADDRAALADPRVRLLHRDGRRWLMETVTAYDVVLLQLPAPSNAQINRLYTVEAFAAVRRHLAPGGLLAFTIPSSENYLSPDTRYFNACLFQTLQAAFPSVALVAGDPVLLLAGEATPALDPLALARRIDERGLQTRVVVPSYFPIKLDARRREALRAELASIHPPLNRDFIPVCYTYAWRVWLAKFVSPLYFLGLLGLVALLGWMLCQLWRQRVWLRQAPGPAALFALGGVGLVDETALLLAFQSLHGYVYWQLGTLFACFMLGLALGSGLAMRRLADLSTTQAHHRLRWLLAGLSLEGVLCATLLPVLQHAPAHVPWLALFGGLLLTVAAWIGAAFPLALRLAAGTVAGRVVGPLYAADLWGAALGALCTSAFLIPLVGLTLAIGLASALLCLAAVLLPPPQPSV